jgi:hypothetical protein
VEFLNILLKVTKEMRLPIFEKKVFGGDLGLGFDLGFPLIIPQKKSSLQLV